MDFEYLKSDASSPWTMYVAGEDIFDYFDDVFDEIDAFMRMHKNSMMHHRGDALCMYSQQHNMPRLHIKAVRQWWFSSECPRYDTVPDDIIESICDGIPPSRFVLDFTELFKQKMTV